MQYHIFEFHIEKADDREYRSTVCIKAKNKAEAKEYVKHAAASWWSDAPHAIDKDGIYEYADNDGGIDWLAIKYKRVVTKRDLKLLKSCLNYVCTWTARPYTLEETLAQIAGWTEENEFNPMENLEGIRVLFGDLVANQLRLQN